MMKTVCLLVSSMLLLSGLPLTAASRCNVIPFEGNDNYITEMNAPARGVLADFDGDGKLDLIATEYWGVDIATSSRILFYPLTWITLPIAQYTDVATADFDGRNGLDVAGVSPTAGIVFLALNKGDASFTVTTYPLPNAKRVLTGDFNRDGNADLLVASTTGEVTAFFGNGDGTLRPATLLFTTRAAPTAFTAADVNGDGKLDLLLGYAGFQGVDLMGGKGNGTFNPPTVLPFGNSVFDIVVSDATGDGKLDILTANNDDGTLGVTAGLGEGRFSAPVFYTTIGLPGAIAVGDLNGDGLADVFVMNTYGGFFVHRNLGGGSFNAQSTPRYVSTARLESGFLFLADLNGDGLPDAITSGYYDGSAYLLNACGKSDSLITAYQRTVNPSQPVHYELDLWPHGTVYRAAPTGTVTLKYDSTVLSTLPLNGVPSVFPYLDPTYPDPLARSVVFDATFATTGAHIVTMEYSGDENYEPASIHAGTTTVTSVTTSMTLAVSPDHTDYVTGFLLTPSVKASDGSAATGGSYDMTANGTGNYGSSRVSAGRENLPPGAYVLVARYNGDATHAPSGPSDPATVVISKSTPDFSASLSTANGTTSVVAVLTLARQATGRVLVTENSALRGSSAINTENRPTATVSIPLNVLPPGTHTLHVAYTGDNNVNGVDKTLTLTLPGTPPPPKRRAAPHS